VSKSSSMRWMVIPMSGSPLRIAQRAGAGPRYFGNKDEWILIKPNRGMLSTWGGIFHGNPYETARSRSYPESAFPRPSALPGSSRSVPGGIAWRIRDAVAAASGSVAVRGFPDRL